MYYFAEVGRELSLAASQLKPLASLSADHFLGSFGYVRLPAHRTRKNLYLLQTDIAFLIWNLSNLDHNLFPDWNGMPYKCMQNTSPIYSRTV